MINVAEKKAKQVGVVASRAQFLLGANVAAGIYYLSDATRIDAIYMQYFMSGLGSVIALVVLSSAMLREWHLQQLAIFEADLGEHRLKIIKSGRLLAMACVVSAGALLWGAFDHGLHLLGLYDDTTSAQASANVGRLQGGDGEALQ